MPQKKIETWRMPRRQSTICHKLIKAIKASNRVSTIQVREGLPSTHTHTQADEGTFLGKQHHGWWVVSSLSMSPFLALIHEHGLQQM